MRVVILAAGYGTRLYPLTINLPKPLVQVKDTPIINFLMAKIDCLRVSAGITHVVVVSNDKFYPHFCAWKKKYAFDVTILNDGSKTPEDRLGAVGDMRFAFGNAQDDWLVLGGDNLFKDDISKFIQFASQHRPWPCLGAYDIKDVARASHYGIVKIDRRHRVISFKEKPKKPDSTMLATCVYFFPREAFGLLDMFIAAHPKVDTSGKYIEWLLGQTCVYAYQMKGVWLDIGHVDELKAAARRRW